ncbi:MAG: penicillin acylase family protein [Pseudoxanthomonas sp.]
MLKWFIRLALLLLALAAALALAGWLLFRGSLAELDGEVALPGLSAPATIQRDALGTATIDAADETDMARALGYAHAQERFFEMDLMRRAAAGELSELFGPVALELDKQRRMHRIRARVAAHLDDAVGDRREQLQAYADGVNAGLAALKARPWPYLLLRQPPRKWEVADSVLVVYAMYFDLQDSGNTRELALWKIRPHLPPALFELLARDGSEWDAPMFGAARGNAALPDAGEVDLRKLPASPGDAPARVVEAETPGSNNWAVGGALTADGRAIVADDMHLGLRAPNIWFRARLRYADPRAPDGKVDVSGFTLPGVPAVVAGSNGHVAWGFTNGYADTADWYPVHPCVAGAESAAACDRTEHVVETIRVAGSASVALDVVETDYGPVLHEARGDRPALALRWVAQQPGAANMGLADLARAADLSSALAVAEHAATPAQNLVVADRDGGIAWRVLGPLPARSGDCRGGLQLALPQGEPCSRWPISTQLVQPLANPAQHRLWSANNRVLDGEGLATVGDGGYVLGARARQIRDDLFARDRFSEKDLLAIQLDDRALFLERWWKLLQAEGGKGGALAELAVAAKHWQGRASAGSASYRIVRAWRVAVHSRIADGLTAPAQAALGDDFRMPYLPQFEGVVWPLLEQRPANLLSRRYSCESPAKARTSMCGDANGWDALLEDAARAVRDDLARHGPLEQRRWGERNAAKICHPLAMALPAVLAQRLCMPADELDGDTDMPRVAGPGFGASERMVVSPGHEADGIIHMPGGQSGHPLSPFWGAGHKAWVKGEPTPFLPGETKYNLRLRP